MIFNFSLRSITSVKSMTRISLIRPPLHYGLHNLGYSESKK